MPASAATIEVTTTNDEAAIDGDCSLREAVEAARSNQATDECRKGKASETDVVELGANTYELDIASTNESNNQNGDLDITGGGSVTLRGAGVGDTEITTALDDRILEVFGPRLTVTLEGLQISGGEAPDSEMQGGNISVQSASDSRLILRNALVLNGEAPFGGNVSVTNGVRLKVVKSTVGGGTASLIGGGIYLAGEGRLEVKRSLLSLNDVNAGSSAGRGGAIFAAGDSTVTISDTTISGNVVETSGSNQAGGGGVFSEGELEVERSLFLANDVDAAAAAQDENGGAIHHLSSDPARIVNTTFAVNSASDLGGAYYTNGATTTMAHVTFSQNDAAEGDHLFSGPAALTRISNSILPSELSGDACATSLDTIRSKGYNIFNLQDPDCPLKGTDEVVSDVGFDPGGLEDNGGPTSSIGLQKSSEAVNLIPLKKCKVSDREDQRGFDRPKGRKCDAGAVERGAKP